MDQRPSDPVVVEVQGALSHLAHRRDPAEVMRALGDMPDGVILFMIDRDRRIVQWNRTAERLLQFSRQEVLGQFCLMGIRRPDCVVACRMSHTAPGQVVQLYRRDGGMMQARCYDHPFYDAEGHFDGGIEVLVPVREGASGPTDEQLAFHGLVTRDGAMSQVFQVVRRVARTRDAVLLHGEPGTGRRALARAVHDESDQRDGPLVVVDCLELSCRASQCDVSHLAVVDDLIARAAGGTLFFHELTDLSAPAQALLSRRLPSYDADDRRAGDQPRLVASTTRDLAVEVREGRFRLDLLLQLQVLCIELPPLRARPDDVQLHATRWLGVLNTRSDRQVERIADDALAALCAWPWPGNVPELYNAVTHAHAVGSGPELRLQDLPPALARARTESARAPAGDDAALAGRVRAALAQADGNVAVAAERLGVSRSTLWRWRKQLKV